MPQFFPPTATLTQKQAAPRSTDWLITLWRWVVNTAVYGLIALLALNLNRIAIYVRLAPDSSLYSHWLRLLVGTAVTLLLTSAVHELGHLAAGKMARLRFHLLVIGPLRIEQQANGMKLSWQRGGALFNGLAASLPDDTVNLPKRMLLFAAGGPAASLLLALAAGGAAWALRDSTLAQNQAWLWETAVHITAVSSFFFLTTMRPGSYANGYLADGGRIQMLLQNDAAATRWCALVALSGADARGQRPRDWPADLLAQATAVTDHAIDHLTAHILAYQAALDRQNIATAGELLAELVDSWTALASGWRGRLALEQAYFLAFHMGDGENGRFWLDQVRRHSSAAQPLQRRAEAAVLLAEGKYALAETAVRAGLTALATEPSTGTNKSEQEWLQAIATKLSTMT